MPYDRILEDPSLLIKNSEELEDLIVRLLMRKETIDKSEEKIVNEYQTTLNDLLIREEELTNEYEKASNEYKTITTDNIKLNTTINPLMTDWDFKLLIQDLHRQLHAMGEQGNTSSLDTTTKRTSMRSKTVLDLTKECNDRLKAMEIVLNANISKLTKYESDYKTFCHVIFKRKHALKDIKQMEYKQKMQSILTRKREQAEERANRIIVKSRKTQAPFIFNKKEKQVSIDLNEIKEMQNNDLIHFH